MTRHITFQQEFLHTCKEESKKLINLHWEEIALNKDTIKLNPDWTTYQDLENLGQLRIFTARDKGELVGYFVVIVNYNLHYKEHLFANNDIIFMQKEYRKGFTGIKLIKFAEECLRDDGVSVLNINTKLHKDFGAILDRTGYRPIETVYSKLLTKD